MKPKPIRLYFRVAMMLLMLLTSAQKATAQEAAVYDLVTEVPTVDGGQATNMQSSYDYGSLVDGNTSTIYGISNANPWVEFHYSRAFVPKKYILWTGDSWSFAYNPATWTIKAKLNKTDEWTTLATVDNSSGNQLPENDHVSKEFSIESNTNAYKYFRFEATRKNNGTFQLGELQFKEATPKVELTWNMSDQSSMQYTISGNSADFVSNGNTMRYTWTGTPGWNLWGSAGYYLFHKAIENQLQVTFPYLTGKVTKVEINNINFSPAGMSLSVSNGTANLKNENSDYLASTDDTSGSSVTFKGEIDVNTSNYLRFTFVKTASGNVSNQRFDFMNNGSIKVTLVKEQKADLGHTFTTSSVTTSGSTLTATCTSTDADHVALYGANHHFTLTLNAADGMAEPSRPVYATITPAVSDFNEDTQLGATCTVEYAPQGTTNWTTSAPYTAGNYTARATVRINSTDYVLTTNFSVIEGHYVTNNCPQFSVNKTGAMAGENITVTFTPKMGESLTTLTVTGDNTSLSLDNGISDNGDNTYTFAMPNENVTLGGTFTFPMNADNFAQDGDTYTIKNADGWDYFCQRIQYDTNIDGFSGKTVELAANISVTTMAGMVHPFKGTFDGKGKTLTFNRTADAMYTAPFQNTNGATICNLHVTGVIEGGTNSYIGGLVGSANGNLTIRDCHVSTQISTTFDSNTLSANVGIGGFVGLLSSQYNQCHITGCVFDGLIYNPNYSGTTYGCGGFIGAMSQYGYAILEDCLFIEGQYDNNGGKHELLWGHDNYKNSTFFHRSNNQGEGTLKNCFFVATHFLKQGSPAVESATAPTNFAHFGDPTTDYGFLKVYGHTMVFDNKYYTPTYGDLVETYDYSGVKSYNIEYDDKPLGIPDITTQLWVPLLRYKRTFTNGKPVTVMMPFNFTKSAFKKSGSSDGLTGHFYEFKGINGSAPIMESANEVTEMKANTPYLYVPDDEPEYWYIYNDGDGVNIFTQDNGGGTKVTEYDGYELHGTYTEKVWEENDPEIGKAYLIGDGGELLPVTAGTWIRPTECYVIQTAWAGTVDVTVNVTGSGSVSIGNQTATEGNPFTTSVDDGASVTLTIAPDAGNIVTSAKLSYKPSEYGTDEKDIAISGSTATFQMPNDIWNGTGVTINVTFGDGLAGGADEASAVALTDATVSNLAGGYYKVESDISFDHTLNLIGDTYLVIASGAKMTVSSSEYGINGGSYALNVLGEGTLNVTTTGSYKIAVCVSSYTQSGCSVNLTTTYIGMRCSDSFNISGGSFKTNGSEGIWPDNAVNISGGKLEASNIDANINLSYSSTDDYIKVDNYTSGKTMTIANGQTFTDGTTNYSGTITNLSPLNGKKLFPFVYMHLTVRDATCTEVGIKQECWQRSSDGKYFLDENGTNELNASDVEIPMISHNGIPHEATDTHIAYWQCSMCSKYFSEEGCTTEITEEDTKIYRTITIDGSISGLVTSNVDKAVAGTTVTLTVSHLIDASTLRVNGGSVTLTDAGNGTYTFTVPAADVTVTASTATTYSVNLPANMEIVSATITADGDGKYISGTVVTFKASFSYTASNVSDGANTLTADGSGNYSVTVGTADITVTATIGHNSNIDLSQAPSDFTVVDGDVLTGSTSHTVTIANNAKITLSNATISGGIVCEGTAEITLVGTNSVSVSAYNKAGIQIGGSGTTLTIKGNGSLNATGGSASAGIGLGRTWDANATSGSVVIEGGTVTASGGNGIGTGTVRNSMTAHMDGIIIKGGTVNARLGKGTIYYGSSVTIGTLKIYDGIEKVDASAITESVTYMHVDGNTETDVTASASTYFTIIEDGDRRIIEKKDNTDYTITIADNSENGTIACAAVTAKYGEKITITATPDFGYRLSRLVVKDTQNNSVASTGNSFFMPKSNVTVSAVFEQGVHGTTEFAWSHYDGQGLVTDATIYDGVTTVNLQQERSYRIIKYSGYSYSKFLLDNDTYNVNIPYAGGTGAFVQNGTSFNNNGDAGFYDITMTDVGNGKWSVSILKTVGQMDVVPDQTYTGSEIKPEPLVMAGSLNLTKGTDYKYSYTNNTNVGTAKVTVTFQGDYESLGYVEKEFKIVKSMTNNDISITIPSQTWTGNELTPDIIVKDGENVLTENTDYTVTPPSGPIQDSGNHAYTIIGMGNYAGSREATFTISPYLADQFGAVYVYQDQNGKTALLEGTSVEPVDIPSVINKTVNHVTSNRVFTPGKASTVMLPFNYTCNGEEGGTFYKFVGVKKENDKWVATMQETGNDANNEGTLIANTPYLFMPTATEMTFPNINGSVALSTEGGGNCVTADPGSHWTFKGTYWFKEWNSSNYYDAEEIGRAYGFAGVAKDGINVGDFVRVASDAKIRPMRAYLLWSDTPNSDGDAPSNNGLVLTLPEHFKILSVDGQPYTGNGQDLSQGSTIVIELEAGYSATNVEATEQSNSPYDATPPNEIPDYDDYIE